MIGSLRKEQQELKMELKLTKEDIIKIILDHLNGIKNKDYEPIVDVMKVVL